MTTPTSAPATGPTPTSATSETLLSWLATSDASRPSLRPEAHEWLSCRWVVKMAPPAVSQTNRSQFRLQFSYSFIECAQSIFAPITSDVSTYNASWAISVTQRNAPFHPSIHALFASPLAKGADVCPGLILLSVPARLQTVTNPYNITTTNSTTGVTKRVITTSCVHYPCLFAVRVRSLCCWGCCCPCLRSRAWFACDRLAASLFRV